MGDSPTQDVGSPGPLWIESAGEPDRPIVVLVHGSMDRSAGLLKLSRRLDDDFCVVRYDRRGYGRSWPHAGPFTMACQIGDLLTVLHGRRALVVGHSFGGNVALAAAQHHPDLIEAVAIYETPQSWQPWWPGTTAGGAALAHVTDPEAAAEQFMRGLIGDGRWNRLPAPTRLSRRREGVAMTAELDDLRQAAPWNPERIAQPVTAMFGEHAKDHHRRSSEAMPDQFVDALAVEIGGAGHFGPNTHPDDVAEAVRALWARAQAGRRV